jgi:2-polyprenyl-3-methyl-5-hydroxy-6-metoxy-1,4-benzoquinol methylase
MAANDLRTRILEPEEIDDPELAQDQLYGALHGLTRINFLSASAASVWSPIRRLAKRLKTTHLRILDIATGAGDIPVALWRKGKRAGLKLEILGVDISERALDFARERGAVCGEDVQFRQLDVFADEIPPGYDVLVSSLFLHHLQDEQAGKLLAGMAHAANHLVLINDLRRGRYGLMLAYLAGRLLTSSPVVRIDAIRSVRAAFSLEEVGAMAESAGMQGADIRRRWPARYLLAWEKNGSR